MSSALPSSAAPAATFDPDDGCAWLPETPSQFFAYDAIILSNVSRDALSDQHLAWIDEWIGRRGGGLCMVGGPAVSHRGDGARLPSARCFPVQLARGPRLGRGSGERSTLTARAQPPDLASLIGRAQNRSARDTARLHGEQSSRPCQRGGRGAGSTRFRIGAAKPSPRLWFNPSAGAVRWR